jgi:hypothetical protein
MKKYIALLFLVQIGVLNIAFADGGPQWECKTSTSTPIQMNLLDASVEVSWLNKKSDRTL